MTKNGTLRKNPKKKSQIPLDARILPAQALTETPEIYTQSTPSSTRLETVEAAVAAGEPGV